MASASSPGSSTASFVTGLTILFIAQLLSAIMGLYVQLTYAKYGPHWNENLFYSHFLSLPLFAPFFPQLWTQFRRLLTSSPMIVDIGLPIRYVGALPDSAKAGDPIITQFRVPHHVFNLALNSLTQYACIWGVNLLGARTTALGVTIVLNIRKLVSLFISIWLFGNDLPFGVSIGATIVFAGAGVYAWAGQRSAKTKKQ